MIHNYFPPPKEPFVLNLASADATIQQRSLDLVRQAIELCVRLGAPFYSVHAGFITDPYAFGGTHFLFPDSDGPDAAHYAFDRFVSSLLEVSQYARQHNVGLLIENNMCLPDLRGKLLLQTAHELQELLDAVQAPNVGILLDFGHLNISARTLGVNRLEFIERLAPYIHAFHVHDNDGIDDTHKPPQPGSWILDVLRRPELADLPVVIESRFENERALRQHFDWLSTVLECD